MTSRANPLWSEDELAAVAEAAAGRMPLGDLLDRLPLRSPPRISRKIAQAMPASEDRDDRIRRIGAELSNIAFLRRIAAVGRRFA